MDFIFVRSPLQGRDEMENPTASEIPQLRDCLSRRQSRVMVDTKDARVETSDGDLLFRDEMVRAPE